MVFSRLLGKAGKRAKDGEAKSSTSGSHDDDGHDKQWAKRYLLDPLTAPEPSQETGLGASHLNPYRAAVKSSSPSPDQEQEQELASSSHRPSRDSASSGPASAGSSSPAQLPHHRYPTPPSSASPTDRGGGVGCDLDPSNPFSTSFSHRSHSHSRSTSSSSAAFAASLPPFHDTEPSHFYHYSTRSSASSIERPYDHTTTSHQRRHRPTTWGGYSSYSSYGSSNTSNSFCHADQHQHQHQHQQRQRLSGSNSPDYTSTAAEKKAASTEILEVAPVSKNHPLEHRRSSSLGQRFPGDMSHRPLDMIKREVQAAERPHRRRRRINDTDSIDQLDTIGGSYHHGGPYDATLTSRNLNKKYSPVAAVAESNMEAIRATPRENVIDSLRKHVPLQGTSSIPPGVRGPNGRVMRYTEGADLMREPDAEGGAYKRYEDVQYHPDDLKGKGEPSFTIERDLAKNKGHRHHPSAPDAFEMRPVRRRNQDMTRQRSISQGGDGDSSDVVHAANDSDLRRSHTTGKKLSEGLKRRFGSLHRSRDVPGEAVH